MQHTRWRLIKSTADGLHELMVYVEKSGMVCDASVGNSACFLWQLVASSMKKANGRLDPHLFGTLACCNGTVQSVLSRRVVVRVFRDAPGYCDASQNPCEATPRDGTLISLSDATSFVQNEEGSVFPYLPPFWVQELEKSTYVCPRTPEPLLDSTTVWGWEASASQSAKASSMILVLLALVSRRQAAPLKSPSTTSGAEVFVFFRVSPCIWHFCLHPCSSNLQSVLWTLRQVM